MAQVELSGVWKRFDEVVAVRDANLTIDDKEFVVLVGPSGCGKSTMLRMVAGLEEITEGTIRIDDKVVNDLPPKDRDIAMVFQNYALYPHMTVGDNLAFSLKLRKMAKGEIKKRVQNAAEILGIDQLLERKPKQLSGGQRQRVAMGRAIVREPRVFLFDEPLSNLDAKLRVQMRLEIARLHKRLGATIIYVTHDQVEAMTLANRIVVLKDGLIQQVGSPEELFDHPINSFVGTFIGSPSMNLIDVEVDEKEPKVIGQEFEMRIPDKMHRDARNGGHFKAILGLRPQHLAPTDDPNLPGFEVTVEIVEPLGAEAYIYFELDGKQIIGRTEDDPPQPGSRVRFTIEPDQLHLFSEDGSSRVED